MTPNIQIPPYLPPKRTEKFKKPPPPPLPHPRFAHEYAHKAHSHDRQIPVVSHQPEGQTDKRQLDKARDEKTRDGKK